jgi:hypothetical protein
MSHLVRLSRHRRPAPSDKPVIPNGWLPRVPGQVPACPQHNGHQRARIARPFSTAGEGRRQSGAGRWPAPCVPVTVCHAVEQGAGGRRARVREPARVPGGAGQGAPRRR